MIDSLQMAALLANVKAMLVKIVLLVPCDVFGLQNLDGIYSSIVSQMSAIYGIFGWYDYDELRCGRRVLVGVIWFCPFALHCLTWGTN